MSNSDQDKTLSIYDGIALVGGVVVGAGIFKTPALVAGSFNTTAAVVWAWALGGAVSLTGALCYAELASAFPGKGGEYDFLLRAYGGKVAFLFAWARIMVIQTGSIVMLAFLIGDYASEVFSLGSYSPSIYAAAVVAGLTLINAIGLRTGSAVQRIVFGLVLLCLFALTVVGFTVPSAPLSTPGENRFALGRAMIFVLLTYGGWNEAAYISAEVKGSNRNIVRVLVYSIVLITLVYCIINIAFLRGLGMGRIVGSDAVAADLMSRVLGASGAVVISAIIVLASLSTANASIITGARTSYALGRNFSLFRFVHHWDPGKNAPVRALFLQALLAFALIAIGTGTRSGFSVMVEYTAPVFWLFFLLTGVSLFTLRLRAPEAGRPFKVPLYPLTPALFCAACVYMLHASVAHTGFGALIGLGVLLSGIPFLFTHKNEKPEEI